MVKHFAHAIGVIGAILILSLMCVSTASAEKKIDYIKSLPRVDDKSSEAFRVEATDDGGYIVGGLLYDDGDNHVGVIWAGPYYSSSASTRGYPYLAKYKADGTQEWISYSDSQTLIPTAIRPVSNGYLLVTRDATVISFSGSGEKTNEEYFDILLGGAVINDDGSYVLNPATTGALYLYDVNNDLIQQYTYLEGYQNNIYAGNVIPFKDGYVVAGVTGAIYVSNNLQEQTPFLQDMSSNCWAATYASDDRLILNCIVDNKTTVMVINKDFEVIFSRPESELFAEVAQYGEIKNAIAGDAGGLATTSELVAYYRYDAEQITAFPFFDGPYLNDFVFLKDNSMVAVGGDIANSSYYNIDGEVNSIRARFVDSDTYTPPVSPDDSDANDNPATVDPITIIGMSAISLAVIAGVLIATNIHRR